MSQIRAIQRMTRRVFVGNKKLCRKQRMTKLALLYHGTIEIIEIFEYFFVNL